MAAPCNEAVSQGVRKRGPSCCMNPMDVFWFHNALTLVTAGTDVLPITSEQVGVFKLMKITAEIKKLHEETKKSGKEVTVRDVCKISDSIMKL